MVVSLAVRQASLSVTPRLKQPTAAPIALVKDGDTIEIDIPNRGIKLAVPDNELHARREEQQARGDAAYTPVNRQREVSFALRAYALLATSADKGAVRDKSKLGG